MSWCGKELPSYHDCVNDENDEIVDVVFYDVDDDDDDDDDDGSDDGSDGAGLERVIGPADGWLGCRPTAEHHSRSCLDFSIMMMTMMIPA